ncbi:hypothetical protein A2U01_0054394 [Trifolium medium]|uniref:Uncharacterized protein n=1 Tax=Trifolium medium TaxID=97028 RepID=A0A392R966_9FABA|nr:hypothetical protein [Trifolium medium]
MWMEEEYSPKWGMEMSMKSILDGWDGDGKVLPDFEDLCFLLLAAAQEHRRSDIVMILWCVWKRRNEKVWEEVVKPQVYRSKEGQCSLAN